LVRPEILPSFDIQAAIFDPQDKLIRGLPAQSTVGRAKLGLAPNRIENKMHIRVVLRMAPSIR
jgi:hypothetical protein